MSNSRSTLREVNFKDAVETLQQIKTKFTPVDKIGVVVDTVRNINQSIVNHFWSMDELFPVFLYVMVRARIPQMGAEIAMIEDLIIKGGESDSDDSRYGRCFFLLNPLIPHQNVTHHHIAALFGHLTVWEIPILLEKIPEYRGP